MVRIPVWNNYHQRYHQVNPVFKMIEVSGQMIIKDLKEALGADEISTLQSSRDLPENANLSDYKSGLALTYNVLISNSEFEERTRKFNESQKGLENKV